MEIIPTNNIAVKKAMDICVAIVPEVTRKIISRVSSTFSSLEPRESLGDKRVVGTTCLCRARQGFLVDDCVFSIRYPIDINRYCPKGVETAKIIQNLGECFRENNPNA